MSIGTPLTHDSAQGHVTGAAHYIDDIPTPAGTLHLCFGLSDVARGTIRALDLDAVREAEGVVAVLTAEDIPDTADTSPSVHDEPLLARDTVHYAGQALFLVVAQTHLAARKAARLAKVEIDAEPPVLSYEDALEAGADLEDHPLIWERGDAQQALSDAPHKLSGEIEIGGQEHFYLEGQIAMAAPEDDGGMAIWSSTQHPSEIQHKVAHALGLPMAMIAVQTRRMGGGFGGKESQGNALAMACALAARATGRPCKMRYDRDDDMRITGKRHDFRISYEVGFDDQGRILGLSVEQLTRGGWSRDLTTPVADRAMLHADNAYRLPNIRIFSRRLRTNMASATAFRGFGGPQGILGMERIIDHIAGSLGRDPVEIRALNYYTSPRESMRAETGDFETREPGRGSKITMPPARAERFGGTHSPEPRAEKAPNVTPYGMEVRDAVITPITDRLLADARYHARRDAIAEWNRENDIFKRGIGFSPVKFGISFTLTHLNQAGALVHIYQDGSVHLNHGGTEMGQGLFRKISQVAAESFGLPIEAIRITATHTGKVPNTSATAASSGTDLNGMAVKAACDTIRSRMVEALAGLHGVPPEAIRFEDGQVWLGDAPIAFADAAKRCYENRVSLSSTGYYKTPGLSWDRERGAGRPFFYFAYGAALSEVVIDTLTGENRILRTDILHDAGASLNPALDIGQIEGGFVQGAGWLTTEELVWNDAGTLLSHAPSTYKIPTARDVPAEFNVALWDKPNLEHTIYRSKAVGEPPFMHGISVFLALSHAISSCGPHYPALNAPATPEEILNAIARARG